MPYLIQELIYDHLRGDRDDLFKIADFHIHFEHIHPFVDENGRTGRLIIDQMLMHIGMMPIVIKSEDRSRYFDLLANYDTEGLVSFISELQAFEEEKMKAYLSL